MNYKNEEKPMQEKQERLKRLIQDLHTGRDEELVKEEFKREFGEISATELAKMEQNLIAEGMSVFEIQRLCNIHADIFAMNIAEVHQSESNITAGHPLFVFEQENTGVQKFIQERLVVDLDAYRDSADEANQQNLLASLRKLSAIDKHYKRKENLFFPYLEARGITGPPQVMWGKDDEIRALVHAAQEKSLSADERITRTEAAIAEVESMITKENQILKPMLLDNITKSDWVLIARDSAAIGYAFNGGIEGASPSDANTWLAQFEESYDEAIHLAEEAVTPSNLSSYIALPSGRVQLTDFVSMMNTSPQDFTFIDAEDKVVYFSEGKDMVFPRTRTIIGRDVRLCHPPRAVPIVEQLLADFKAGTRDVEVRFVEFGTKVLLVRYFAVRDGAGRYIGTLETTEEISGILEAYKNYKQQNRGG